MMETGTKITDERQLATVCHETLRGWPEARAAVLFGSRARGDWHPESDWDIAVILDGDTPVRPAGDFPQGERLGRLHNVHAWVAGCEDIANRASDLGTLPCAVTCDGLLLAGDWDRPEQKEMSMKSEDWYRQMHMVCTLIGESLNQLRSMARMRTWMECEDSCRLFLKNSSSGAECLVKAMMARRGVRADRSHDILSLVESFAEERPDQVDLAERMERLNGHSRSDNQAGYVVEPFTPVGCRKAVDRLKGVLDLLASELESDTDGDAMREVIPRLVGYTLDEAEYWKDSLDVPVKPKPEEESMTRKATSFILDEREQIRQAIADFVVRIEHLHRQSLSPDKYDS